MRNEIRCRLSMAFPLQPTMSDSVCRESRIYVAGHNGLVGSAILRELVTQGYQNLVVRSHSELDLTDPLATKAFFESERPDIVILAAAVVGGINANNTNPVRFLTDNLAIQTNVINSVFQTGVARLLFLGSSCIYPRDCPQPIKEEYLLTGPLEATNRPYAIAKISGIEACWAFNREHGTRYLSIMPANLYGLNDTYDLRDSHVLPALIKKMSNAINQGDSRISLWGTGSPLREFLFSDDLARACVLLVSLADIKLDLLVDDSHAPLINVGSNHEVSIAELADLVADELGFTGEIEWDKTMPDGTPRKLLDSSIMRSLGWNPQVSLREGIALVCAEYSRRAKQIGRGS